MKFIDDGAKRRIYFFFLAIGLIFLGVSSAIFVRGYKEYETALVAFLPASERNHEIYEIMQDGKYSLRIPGETSCYIAELGMELTGEQCETWRENQEKKQEQIEERVQENQETEGETSISTELSERVRQNILETLSESEDFSGAEYIEFTRLGVRLRIPEEFDSVKFKRSEFVPVPVFDSGTIHARSRFDRPENVSEVDFSRAYEIGFGEGIVSFHKFDSMEECRNSFQYGAPTCVEISGTEYFVVYNHPQALWNVDRLAQEIEVNSTQKIQEWLTNPANYSAL